MRIEKFKLMMDKEYKNILASEFVTEYPGNVLLQPESIVNVMNDVFDMSDMAEEHLYLIAMTCKGKPLSFFEVSHGTNDCSEMSIRGIMIRVLLCGASNFVIVHNHPSGSPMPSKEDISVTIALQEASKLIGINFCDHIIIGRDGYLSFCNEKMFELLEERKTQICAESSAGTL